MYNSCQTLGYCNHCLVSVSRLLASLLQPLSGLGASPPRLTPVTAMTEVRLSNYATFDMNSLNVYVKDAWDTVNRARLCITTAVLLNHMPSEMDVEAMKLFLSRNTDVDMGSVEIMFKSS